VIGIAVSIAADDLICVHIAAILAAVCSLDILKLLLKADQFRKVGRLQLLGRLGTVPRNLHPQGAVLILLCLTICITQLFAKLASEECLHISHLVQQRLDFAFIRILCCIRATNSSDPHCTLEILLELLSDWLTGAFQCCTIPGCWEEKMACFMVAVKNSLEAHACIEMRSTQFKSVSSIRGLPFKCW